MTVKVLVKIKKLAHFDSTLPVPTYQTDGAAGADLCASLENRTEMVIKPGERVLISTGLIFEIPTGYEIQVRPRSGLSLKTGLMVMNTPGTIDCDYRGEVKVILGNLGSKDEIIKHGDRIAQVVLAPVVQANFVFSDNLSDTRRGAGGFGSTGTK